MTAYVIDTGIRSHTTSSAGAPASGFDAVDGGWAADDCNGHGTHVAGTIGGATYGVAKGVSLVAVRVLDCNGSGTWSGVIAGIDWVAGNHQSGAPAVANMSLGGGASTTVDNAVKNAIADGVTFAIAAGNSNADACRFSPARVPEAHHRRRHHLERRQASYSNYGQVPGPVRTRLVDHLGLEQRRHRHEHDQRHVDGDPACRGRGCASTAGREPVPQPGGARPRGSGVEDRRSQRQEVRLDP